jgi:hypothetical protein
VGLEGGWMLAPDRDIIPNLTSLSVRLASPVLD